MRSREVSSCGIESRRDTIRSRVTQLDAAVYLCTFRRFDAVAVMMPRDCHVRNIWGGDSLVSYVRLEYSVSMEARLLDPEVTIWWSVFRL